MDLHCNCCGYQEIALSPALQQTQKIWKKSGNDQRSFLLPFHLPPRADCFLFSVDFTIKRTWKQDFVFLPDMKTLLS